MTGHPRFIVVSPEFIAAGGTAGMGFTKRQIQILDGRGRPQKGWRSRAIGKRLSYERAHEFLIDAKRPSRRPQPGSIEEREALALLERCAAHPRPVENAKPDIWRVAPAKLSPGDAACPLCQGQRKDAEGKPCVLCQEAPPPDRWELLAIVAESMNGATRPIDAVMAIETAAHLFRFFPSDIRGAKDRPACAVAGLFRQLARILKPQDGDEPELAGTPPWEPLPTH